MFQDVIDKVMNAVLIAQDRLMERDMWVECDVEGFNEDRTAIVVSANIISNKGFVALSIIIPVEDVEKLSINELANKLEEHILKALTQVSYVS